MKRTFGALVVGLLAVAIAQAHFPFIVPEADGGAAKVIFSDDLVPDTNVNVEKLANTKLFLRDSGGKDMPLESKKGDGFYSVVLPGSGPRVVYGVTEYGVLQKGDAKPFRLVYFPKAVVGGPAAKPVGDPLKVEILAAGAAGKTRFQVIHAGKPVADAEVTVLLPGDEKDKDKEKKPMKAQVKTDKEGFTPPYAAAGRYGVFARVTNVKAGEFAGKKYEETRFYATLVTDVGK
jgi:uncharacterized GH25 family protein